VVEERVSRGACALYLQLCQPRECRWHLLHSQSIYDTLGKNTKAYTLFHLGGSYRAAENLTINATIYNLFDKDFVDGSAYTTYSTPRYNSAGVITAPGGVPGDPAYGTDYSHFGAATTGIVEEGRRLWLSANFTF